VIKSVKIMRGFHGGSECDSFALILSLERRSIGIALINFYALY